MSLIILGITIWLFLGVSSCIALFIMEWYIQNNCITLADAVFGVLFIIFGAASFTIAIGEYAKYYKINWYMLYNIILLEERKK